MSSACSAPQGLANLGLGKRSQHLPVETHALGDADAPMARHQGLGEFDEQVVQVVAKLGAGLERIAKAARGEQRRARALALDDRVGRQGRAVHDGTYRIVARLGLLEHLRDRRQHRLRRMLRRGQHLGRIDAARPLIDEDHVGERAADVDPDGDMLALFHVRACPGFERSARLAVKAAARLADAKRVRRPKANSRNKPRRCHVRLISSNRVFP